ncbi:hypothetical protein SCACP_15100 [Sporomusa carbonis]|uniref:FeoA family protein n=1 Tax=Sporomusa carbonis TaxID=3076075 RepID=UPI003A633954
MAQRPVTMLEAGERAKIVAIKGQDARSLRKLTVFGLLPGMEIEVMQTFPVYVLRIDNTQLALDREAASGIMVIKVLKSKGK